MTLSFINKIYCKFFKKPSLFNLPKKDIFVVIGGSRNGTSLIMELLKTSGIFVGREEDFKKPDENNPRGYFEHSEEHEIDRRLRRQINSKEKTPENFSLDTRNLIKKIQCFILRARMNRFLVKIYNQAENKLALKLHSSVFPLWQRYIPNLKLIIAYKHPVVAAHSNIKFKNFEAPFHSYILRWEKLYKEFIYYYGRYPSIVINVDDLFNPEKRDIILKGLINFTGKGRVDDLRKIITPELNRSYREIKKIMDIYPLPQSTVEVLESLEKLTFF